MTEEEIKLFDRLNIAWEFPKNKDLPIVILTYVDDDGKLWCLRGSYKDEGTMNVGKEYRNCMEKFGKKGE